MEIVVDTNIVAYALLLADSDGITSRRVLARSTTIVVPDVLRAELANVLWQWVRFRQLDVDVGVGALENAGGLISEVVPTDSLWADSLRLAVAAVHPVYDTLFIALARQRGTRLVTFDRRLRSAFPDDVLTPAEYDAIIDRPDAC